ncbi:hypothetical protein I7I48_03020 [Histoplasma ohiense]|nr:hypothetical protein I7I48_03020 [Histoplasma ohiense (nom. inval.)]
MEQRGVTEAIIKGPKHNDHRNPDPQGDHWTVEMVTESGEFVTKRYVYPEAEGDDEMEEDKK